MKKYLFLAVSVAALASAPVFAATKDTATKDTMSLTSGSTMQHVISNSNDLTWNQGPASLPAGVQMAVLQGDPDKPGMFTVRAKMPAGYKIPLHTHPTDELVTVLDGTFSVGMDSPSNNPQDVTAGGFVSLPAGMRHYAQTAAGATIQISGMGPFAIQYVNPQDDPRKQTRSTGGAGSVTR
jgi:quercetin dioxygenase-like cupin family protein